MSTVYFVSDLHVGHARIIEYCNRPFSSVEEMDKTLIDKWNAKVKPEDTVYILGDLCWKHTNVPELLKTLNGEKHLIRGNHDGYLKNYEHLFASVNDYLKIRIADSEPLFESGVYQHIVMSHYAFRVWDGSHRGTFSIWGHSHGTLSDDPNSLSIDVGVDCHNFEPISYAELKDIMRRKTPVFKFGDT